MTGEIIVALDFPNAKEALAFVDGFSRRIFVKVGMELFYSAGPAIVEELKRRGHKVFLDLKICDIPNTAKGAMKSLASLKADIVDCHCMGGKEMMRQAVEGLKEGSEGAPPLCVGVTLLTSIDQKALHEELGISGEVSSAVFRCATAAKEAGLRGVVCSPFEAREIHRKLGDRFLTVCPGIRFAGASSGDQKRVATPAFASEQGCDFIVVGRAITRAVDPIGAYEECEREFHRGAI